MSRLFRRMRETGSKHPNRPILELPDGDVFSWRDFDVLSAQYALLLADFGLERGDRVAVQVEKSPEALVLYLACLRSGLVYLPMNPSYQEDEVRHILTDANPKLFVIKPSRGKPTTDYFALYAPMRVLTMGADGSGVLPGLAQAMDTNHEIVESQGEDLAAILYTSGTTGRPKGAMITHGNLLSNAESLVKLWSFKSTDVLLHALPIFHVHGLFVAVHCALLSGAKMLFLPGFEETAVIGWLPRATVMMGVPTYYTRLLARSDLTKKTCPRMRLFISGSAPLGPEAYHAFRERTGHTLLERYGMTETGMLTSNPLTGERKPGSVGRPLPETELRVTSENGDPVPAGEPGMIEVRGPGVFSGYWGRERSGEDFTSDGWFRTGDLGRIDDEGYVTIVGRARDLIISGGLNVYPREVEAVLEECPGVAEAAVFGIPDRDLGERVAAAIVRLDSSSLTEDSVSAFVKSRLAHFKAPRRVLFVEQLPRNAMGKVEKNILRKSLFEVN